MTVVTATTALQRSEILGSVGSPALGTKDVDDDDGDSCRGEGSDCRYNRGDSDAHTHGDDAVPAMRPSLGPPWQQGIVDDTPASGRGGRPPSSRRYKYMVTHKA
jgi:hypothetical protein